MGGLERAPHAPLAGSERPGGAVALLDCPTSLSVLLENRLELELAADGGVGFHGLEARHGVVVDVTVLVEAPLAVDALEVLRRRDGLAQGLALVGDVLRLLNDRRRALDGVDDRSEERRVGKECRSRWWEVI